MVNAIGTTDISSVQMLNAFNAFKTSEQVKDSQIPEVSDGLGINDNSVLKSQDTDEIRQFAKIVGEENLSDEDIQYGLTYGRSVIADYMI
ncbi:MAG: hypothetical protein PHC64_03875 [Candidatus Gastranaerophilales bacterium]|nr:hypothetical protein [Candidatus Gastranaerophilales bacterium]